MDYLLKNTYISDFLSRYEENQIGKLVKYLNIIAIDFLLKYSDSDLTYEHVQSIASK